MAALDLPSALSAGAPEAPPAPFPFRSIAFLADSRAMTSSPNVLYSLRMIS